MAEAKVKEVHVPRWWSFLLRGIAAFIFGIIILAWPGSTTKVLVFVFGLFVLVAGIAAFAATYAEVKREESFFVSLLIGIVCVVIGIMTMARPGAATVTVLYLIAAWAIIYGFMIIVSGFEAPKGDANVKWLLVLTGVLSIILGIILIALPGLSVLSIVLLVGIYALIQGVLLAVVSLRTRKLYKSLGIA
ncbi:MAG TPA: DUF308 domain-containing protein [Candidatus Anoxymicrobiaceae bacterium]